MKDVKTKAEVSKRIKKLERKEEVKKLQDIQEKLAGDAKSNADLLAEKENNLKMQNKPHFPCMDYL